MIDTARIAKNTIFLYIRMILVLAANFYAVRILLEVLGVEDYGLFNLIVGFVTLFTFLNGAMMSTVQRFLCYAMGTNVGAASSPRLQGGGCPYFQMRRRLHVHGVCNYFEERAVACATFWRGTLGSRDVRS